MGPGPVAVLPGVGAGEAADAGERVGSVHRAEVDATELGEGLTWDQGEGRVPGFSFRQLRGWVGGPRLAVTVGSLGGSVNWDLGGPCWAPRAPAGSSLAFLCTEASCSASWCR